MPKRPAPTPAEKAASLAVTSELLASLCEAAGDWTMGAQQLNLLLQLYLRGGIYQKELEKYTRVERSANSRNIAKLGGGTLTKAGPGYVESVPDLTDRRINRIQLTQRGRALLEAAAEKAALYLPQPQQ